MTFITMASKAFRNLTTLLAAMFAIMLPMASQGAQSANTGITNTDSVTVEVYFQLRKTAIDPEFKDNRARLNELLNRIKATDRDNTQSIGHIVVSGYASPDGSYDLNQRLARERAENMAAYLCEHAGVPAELITVRPMGIDWDGLYDAVENSSMRDKDRVLDLIKNEPEFTYGKKGQGLIRSRKQMLMNLSGGRTWNWMMENLYPPLRSSASVVCYIEITPPEPTPTPFSTPDTDTPEIITEPSAPIEVIEEHTCI